MFYSPKVTLVKSAVDDNGLVSFVDDCPLGMLEQPPENMTFSLHSRYIDIHLGDSM